MQDKAHAIQSLVAAFEDHFFKEVQDDMVLAMSKALALPSALVTQPPKPWSTDLASGSGKTGLTMAKLMESFEKITKEGYAAKPILTAYQGMKADYFKQLQLPYIKTKAPMITFDSLTGVAEPQLPTTKAPTPDDFE